MRSLLKALCLLLVACGAGACDEQTACNGFRSVPQEGWRKGDSLCFGAAVADSDALFRMVVGVRNRAGYPYRDLALRVACFSPDSLMIAADTLEIMLADEQGNWMGHGWGGLYQQSFPAGTVRLGRAGQYVFCVSHAFPDSLLRGINDIGLKLERLPEPSGSY